MSLILPCLAATPTSVTLLATTAHRQQRKTTAPPALHPLPCPPCHCPLLPSYPITCSPAQSLAAAGVCLACTVTWRRAVGLLNEPSRFVRPCRGPWALRANNRGSFVRSNGPGCERGARESIRPGGHANADTGVYKHEETTGNTNEQWRICGVYEREGLGGVRINER